MRPTIIDLLKQQSAVEKQRSTNLRDVKNQQDLQSTSNNVQNPDTDITQPNIGGFIDDLKHGRNPINNDAFGDTKTIYGPELNKDYGKYNDYVSPEEFNLTKLGEVNDIAATNQTMGQKWLSFIGRTGAKTFTELGKTAGYFGGIIPAALEGDINKVFNNSVVNAFRNLDDNLKEQMPVFISDAVQNGTLLDKIGDAGWWATQGADAAGFMASSILAGGAMGSLAKTLELGEKTSLWAITVAQTAQESFAEAGGVNSDLRNKWNSRLQRDNTYKDEEGKIIMSEDGSHPITEDEVNSLIGQSSLESLESNGVLLLAPNFLMAKNLFGRGKEIEHALDGVDISSKEALKDAVNSITPWKKKALRLLYKGPEQGVGEAYQEYVQQVIQDVTTKRGQAKAGDLYKDVGNAMINAFTESEGQESMFLGFIMGLGPGVMGAVKDNNVRAMQAKGLSKLINLSTDNFKKEILSIYKKNEDGTIYTDPKTHKPVIDSEKVVDIINSTGDDITTGALYQEAKQNNNVLKSKVALGDMITKYVLPFLQVKDGVKIWEQHFKEAIDKGVVETETQALGFKDKDEYMSFIREIAKSTEKEYSNILKKGPINFNINKQSLIKNKFNKKEASAVYNNFINKVNSTALYLNTRRNIIKNEISRYEKLTNDLVKNLNEEDKSEGTFEEKLSIHPRYDIENKLIKKGQEILNKQLEAIDKDYVSIYDKNEIQKAFDIEMENSKKLKEGIAKDTEDKKAEDDFEKIFMQNIAEKGYDTTPADKKKGIKNDFSKGLVTLRNDKDEVFKLKKAYKKDGQSDGFKIVNIKNGDKFDLTLAKLRELGLDKRENILSKEEAAEWIELDKIQTNNESRLKIIDNLIENNQNTTKSNFTRIEELQKQLKNYKEQLEEYKKFEDYDENLTVKDVADEILKIEDEISKVKEELEISNKNFEDATNYLNLLKETKAQLISVQESGREFKFKDKIQEINDKIKNEVYNGEIDDLQNVIEDLEDNVKELESLSTTFNNTLNSLYNAIANSNSLESVIKNLNKSTKVKIVKDLLSKIHNIKVLGTDADKLSVEDIKQLIKNDLLRKQTLETLLNDRDNLWKTYNVTKKEFATIAPQIKILKIKLKQFENNNAIVQKYVALRNFYEKLNRIDEIRLRSNIKDNLGKEQLKLSKGSPVEQTSKTEIVDYKKTTPYSTTINTNKGGIQGPIWDRTLSKIPLDKIGDYSIRFVNNEQLEKLGIIPPSNNNSDVYAVLYHGNDKVITDENLVFAGIAYANTYFGNNPTIDIRRESDYLRAIKENPKPNETFSFKNKKGVQFNSLNELEDYLLSEMRDKYSEWRNDLSERLNENEDIYTNLKDISLGVPIIDKNIENKPESVLGEIVNLIIPNGTTLIRGRGTINTAKGMVYGKMKNGQVVRLLNKRLDTLPKAKREETLKSIINFIALSNFIEGKSLTEEFYFENSTKSKIPLVGNKGNFGIMDMFINWGLSGNEWNIFIDKSTNEPSLIFNHKGKAKSLLIKDMFEGDPSRETIKDFSDPIFNDLVAFLDTKYLNVSKQRLNKDKVFDKKNKKNGFWLPIDWKKVNGQYIIVKKNFEGNYKDYALKNILYTNIEKSTDEKSNFTNKYITFDINQNAFKSTPNQITVKPKKVETKEDTKASNPLKGIKNRLTAFENAKSKTTPVFGEEVPTETNEAYNVLKQIKMKEELKDSKKIPKNVQNTKKEDDTEKEEKKDEIRCTDKVTAPTGKGIIKPSDLLNSPGARKLI